MIAHRSLLKAELRSSLRCPVTGLPLDLSPDGSSMSAPGGPTYPVVDGVPVLVDERPGVFIIDEILKGQFRYHAPTYSTREKIVASLPSLSLNVAAEQNYGRLRERLLATTPNPRLLILGGGGLGVGLRELVLDPAFDVVESDVYFGERSNLICDAHQVPFADGTFDCVVLQGVIQALLDPRMAVDEIHRVLKPDGLFYIEANFQQAICDGEYDFNRFTHSGLRRLCRRFEEIESGIQCGPGMALGWTYMYWLSCFAESKRPRVALRMFAKLTGFWIKWLDPMLVKRKAAYDVAAGFYLLGRRSDKIRSDREIIESYRGAFA
ncbi:MAG: class I SAM-dependent methyltransferase [Gemmatimonadaceae bacterium]|nr:class I SAM-dependent methyltransferase [Gemmatimonadaceae bacterium]